MWVLKGMTSVKRENIVSAYLKQKNIALGILFRNVAAKCTEQVEMNIV